MNKCEIIYGDKHVPVKYTCFDIVYYAYKKKKRWVLRKSRINSFCFTNMLSYQLDNGWVVCDEDRLFTDKDQAIEFCLEHNKKDEVKIYNKYLYE